MWIYGCRFIIETDCLPIIQMSFRVDFNDPLLQRWISFLHQINPIWKFVEGRKMLVSDPMSRLSLSNNECCDEKELESFLKLHSSQIQGLESFLKLHSSQIQDYSPTIDQLADIFTKGVTGPRLNSILTRLNVLSVMKPRRELELASQLNVICNQSGVNGSRGYS
ncbi:hypothetical protein BC833DRAFT_639099 [Globomyces pollinis-pini]|nr:hypothetical protein BC833DRAFT_639099 [Globomyces pollinis-pini]KAJ2990528.1 hypothetical protein HDV02_004288 [Globomyces sp. JEL0801]